MVFSGIFICLGYLIVQAHERTSGTAFYIGRFDSSKAVLEGRFMRLTVENTLPNVSISAEL